MSAETRQNIAIGIVVILIGIGAGVKEHFVETEPAEEACPQIVEETIE